MVLDLAGAVTQRHLLHKPQAASGTHRCLRQRLQRQSRAFRLDQEKGPSTPVQRSPYHSALIPGTRSIVTEAASGYLIELRVNNVAQLLHTLDPFPFRGRDLDKEAEEFIVGWAREWIICLVSANVAGGYLIDNPFRRLVEESFFIPGWVANCRRLNTFLIG